MNVGGKFEVTDGVTEKVAISFSSAAKSFVPE
jgi:hypothetical protein